MDEVNIEELKEQFQQGTFYYHKFGLFIKSKVNRVVDKEDIFLEISFEGGNVDVFMDNIKPVKRPCNIIADFKWCYMLKNEYDDVIGYIGLKEGCNENEKGCIDNKKKIKK